MCCYCCLLFEINNRLIDIFLCTSITHTTIDCHTQIIIFDYFIFHQLFQKIIVFLIHFKWKECFKLFRALYSDLFPLKNTWRFGPENRAKFLAAVCLTLPFTDIIKCKHFALAFCFTPYSFHRLIITFWHTLSFSRFLLFAEVFWSMWSLIRSLSKLCVS